MFNNEGGRRRIHVMQCDSPLKSSASQPLAVSLSANACVYVIGEMNKGPAGRWRRCNNCISLNQSSYCIKKIALALSVCGRCSSSSSAGELLYAQPNLIRDSLANKKTTQGSYPWRHDVFSELQWTMSAFYWGRRGSKRDALRLWLT